MKRLRFHYHMEIAFSEPVHDHIYTLKCLPKTTQAQLITECSYHISPSCSVQESTDSFGNRMLYGTAKEEHELFMVDVSGRAVMRGIDEIMDGDRDKCIDKGIEDAGVAERYKSEPDVSVYRYHTSLTRPNVRIKELLAHCREKTENAGQCPLYDSLCIYMGIVHESLKYGKGITNINTTAEEALALGSGVCQDYAQIFISLCRENKIPARYVVGMLMGEGESHAWAEVYDGSRWIGFDPTNNVAAEESHIKISHGRDYHDCSINRGVFTGQAKQKQSILVEVAEEGQEP